MDRSPQSDLALKTLTPPWSSGKRVLSTGSNPHTPLMVTEFLGLALRDRASREGGGERGAVGAAPGSVQPGGCGCPSLGLSWCPVGGGGPAEAPLSGHKGCRLARPQTD